MQITPMLGKPGILFSRHTHAQLHSGPIRGRELGVLTNQRRGQRARHAAGGCHKFLGRDILGSPTGPGSGCGRGFSEADNMM